MIDRSEQKIVDESIEKDIVSDIRYLYCMTYNTIIGSYFREEIHE